MKMREVLRAVAGSTQYDGAGVKLVRVIGHPDVKDFDPFLMLDAFDSQDPADYIKGFPWHPHRGIETVTYLIKGNIEHSDSLGNKGSILDGCCQWMTAGSGILHQEMPQASDHMLGVQLWLNLPKKDKMTAPKYRDITAAMVPKVQEEGITIGVISGQYKGIKAEAQGDCVKMLFLDIDMEPGASWSIPTEKDATLFVYIVQGKGQFGDSENNVFPGRRALLFNKGDEFKVKAGEEGLRFLLFAAVPLKEPIAWGGPIVMNTDHELRQAFQEIKEGTFIK